MSKRGISVSDLPKEALAPDILPLTEVVRAELWAFFGEPESDSAGWPPLPDSTLVSRRGALPAIRLSTPFGAAFAAWMSR